MLNHPGKKIALNGFSSSGCSRQGYLVSFIVLCFMNHPEFPCILFTVLPAFVFSKLFNFQFYFVTLFYFFVLVYDCLVFSLSLPQCLPPMPVLLYSLCFLTLSHERGGVGSIRLMGLRGFLQTMNHFPQISMSAAIKNQK